jgi:two-component system sensor histidine kinase BaeS
MTSSTLPQPAKVPAGRFLDQLFGAFWPEQSLPATPRHVVAALLAGLVAAVVVPFRDAGIGSFLVLMTVGGVVASADRRLRTPHHLVAATLCMLLGATVFVRDAQWIVALCLMAAGAVAVATLTEGRSLPALLVSGLAVPLAVLRGLPWLGRSMTASRTSRSWAPALRTLGLSALLVLVFGLLFASADALFATWAGAVVPDVTGTTVGLRAFLTVAVAGATLTGVYVALNPPRVEHVALPQGTPVTRAFEWLVPVGAVTVLFGVFVAAQLTVMFGGHEYLRRTTGLTYADYVHQGFGQLTSATLLTLAVVAVAGRKAPRGSVRERLVLRAVLGVLCLLTLVVVASALHRMHVYEQAYGFTRLRLLVSVFEGWLGLVVLLVLLAGVRLRGSWVPRAVLLSGAASLLALALANPDAWIARHNLDRFEGTGKVDTNYLAGLSDDAVPALTRAGFGAACLGTGTSRSVDDWLEWNLGRERAADAVRTPVASGCAAAPSGG